MKILRQYEFIFIQLIIIQLILVSDFEICYNHLFQERNIWFSDKNATVLVPDNIDTL